MKIIGKIVRKRKVLNIVYGFIGLYFSYISFLRLWEEGTFGNETHILFYALVGPYIGFSNLMSGLFLTLGQATDFFNMKNAIWFSRISFLFIIISFAIFYFIYGGSYIWSELVDFILFTLLAAIFYLPIIFNGQFLLNKKT